MLKPARALDIAKLINTDDIEEGFIEIHDVYDVARARALSGQVSLTSCRAR